MQTKGVMSCLAGLMIVEVKYYLMVHHAALEALSNTRAFYV